MSVRSELTNRSSVNNSGHSYGHKKSDSTLLCDFCKMSGHIKEKCFYLHGYPPWHKLHGKPKPKLRMSTGKSVNASQMISDTTTTGKPTTESKNACGLSDSQYNQLVQMLQSSMKHNSEGQSSNPWAYVPNVNNVQLAGTAFHYCSTVNSVTDLTHTWIIDSGATDHITPYLHLLTAHVSSSAMLQLPNGQTAKVTHTGTITLSPQLTLSNVLCVPDFSYNLLSISKILHNTNNSVHFSATSCSIQDLVLKKRTEIGKEHEGLYLYNPTKLSQCVKSSSTVCSSISHCNKFVSSVSSTIWHARLGHLPLSKMKHLPFQCNSSTCAPCDSCHFAKQHKLSFSSSDSVSEHVFELIHADLWGPYHTKTHGNYCYFLTLLDDKSRTTWTMLLADKSLVPKLVHNFILYVQNQFSTTIKVFRSDNGSEFLNVSLSNILSSLGIIHQRSCVYTPQQNGKVERKHRHLLNTARALRFHASLPLHFWGDCLLTATYLINRMPSEILHGKTPYEVLFNKNPKFSHLRVFGSLCYAVTLPKPHDKFASRAIKGVFLGYPFDQKGYKILDLITKKVIISRHVHFFEDEFPFKTINSTSDPSTKLFVDTLVLSTMIHFVCLPMIAV